MLSPRSDRRAAVGRRDSHLGEDVAHNPALVVLSHKRHLRPRQGVVQVCKNETSPVSACDTHAPSELGPGLLAVLHGVVLGQVVQVAVLHPRQVRDGRWSEVHLGKRGRVAGGVEWAVGDETPSGGGGLSGRQAAVGPGGRAGPISRARRWWGSRRRARPSVTRQVLAFPEGDGINTSTCQALAAAC